jgi:hypothetical protein
MDQKSGKLVLWFVLLWSRSTSFVRTDWCPKHGDVDCQRQINFFVTHVGIMEIATVASLSDLLQDDMQSKNA